MTTPHISDAAHADLAALIAVGGLPRWTILVVFAGHGCAGRCTDTLNVGHR